jgi:uncharacterized protein YndB with AHSA1/START domain
VFVVVLGGLLAYAATRPDTFRIQRATTIAAPPEKVFALIDDFQQWRAWSPYERKDPAMKRVSSGPARGTGAVYEWDGNTEVGQGRMEIVEATTPSRVTIKLDFLRPFEGHNVAEFALDGQGQSTRVSWAMHGPSPYVVKLLTVFVDMDRMVGKDFETGLANLKAIAEK